MTDAVVYVPPDPAAERWRSVCADYCTRHRYNIVAVAGAWEDVITLLGRGDAQVVVVARRDQLPADRRSRLEVVTEAVTAPVDQSRRRTRRRASAPR